MKFVDEALILVEGGKGGDGCSSFRREKFVPRGGPDGGDGGKGGSVWVEGREGLETLADLEYHRFYRASRGGHGRGKEQHGRAGRSVVIPVPLGTDLYDADTHQYLGSILEPGQRLEVARGGRGGRGNSRFKTSTRQAPRIAEPGGPGERRRLHLVLRLLAQVGLVGLPNSGKSTLLAQLTRARPRIAPYPFTTLNPNLGVWSDGRRRITIVDLPGVIEGAHLGKGLGLKFLRHIERAKTLLLMVDLAAPDPLADYELIHEELSRYNPDLLTRSLGVVFNKLDIAPARPRYELDIPNFYISALTGEGVAEVINFLARVLDDQH